MNRCLEAELLRAVLRRHAHSAVQLVIFVLSPVAIYLVGLPSAHPWQPWGFVVGLASQPFWLLATWQARQWGMWLLSVFYIGIWSAGIYNHF